MWTCLVRALLRSLVCLRGQPLLLQSSKQPCNDLLCLLANWWLRSEDQRQFFRSQTRDRCLSNESPPEMYKLIWIETLPWRGNKKSTAPDLRWLPFLSLGRGLDGERERERETEAWEGKERRQKEEMCRGVSGRTGPLSTTLEEQSREKVKVWPGNRGERGRESEAWQKERRERRGSDKVFTPRASLRNSWTTEASRW